MKALGTLPKKLYSYYLTELYVIFLIGFFVGLIIGIILFSIFQAILTLLGFSLLFRVDFFFTLIFLGSCLIGIFLVPGYTLRKLGNEKVSKLQSRDIPFDYDASKGLKFIPKWLSRMGFTIKLSITGIIRKKGEFKRYFVTFFILSLVLFSFGLGILIVRDSSTSWVRKSQGDNIIAIGHQDVLSNYSKMYNMFSDSELFISNNDINFLDPNYMFNSTDLVQLESLPGIDKIDPRIISFCDVEEMDAILFQEDGYNIVGQSRTGNFPIIGVNQTDLIQSFEVEGNLSLNSVNMSIGDGLAYNFFEYPFVQELSLSSYHRRFEISCVLIDSFYGGYSGYIDLNIYRSLLNLTFNELNLILIQIDESRYSETLNNISSIISSNLGSNFTILELNTAFGQNVNFIDSLMIFPYLFLLITLFVILSTFYHYQKAGINKKIKDFLIMRAIGNKRGGLKKILFLESFYAIFPSSLLSLAVGMILTRLFLLERAQTPPLIIPFTILSLIILGFLLISYLSIIPILKKLDKQSICDLAVF
jgi:ABC-type antimicrobial peptide transport system permease subunit